MTGRSMRVKVVVIVARALGVPVSIPAINQEPAPISWVPTLAELKPTVDCSVYLCPTDMKD